LAHGGNVLEIGLEEAGCDPAGVIKYPALFGIAARLEEIRVEPQNAALPGISEVKKDVGKEERRTILGGDDVSYNVRDYGAAYAHRQFSSDVRGQVRRGARRGGD
jgi:hypothetical protein